MKGISNIVPSFKTFGEITLESHYNDHFGIEVFTNETSWILPLMDTDMFSDAAKSGLFNDVVKIIYRKDINHGHTTLKHLSEVFPNCKEIKTIGDFAYVLIPESKVEKLEVISEEPVDICSSKDIELIGTFNAYLDYTSTDFLLIMMSKRIVGTSSMLVAKSIFG